MSIPSDYIERVYAGVLGKIIGVYLGRPFEGWSYERITQELGEIQYYVHQHFDVPLIVTDDDISGTFTFLRALEDYGHSLELTPAQIGQTWLNYLIEEKTVLWWGGMGNSTEHTAYLRLKQGMEAPHSGSMDVNGKVVAEQIGAQIFIDGWAMVAPGDPELAADLARRAASVSHDGEAIYGAQVLAAMEAQAFVEPDINTLIDTAVTLIPRDSVIYRLIADIRNWHAAEPDWRKTRAQIAAAYGYDSYGGNCHMVPNHALIIHALLHGDDDFQKSLMIVNTCGWDTDCNSGNVGCLLGIKNGLAGIDNGGPDWRTPVADRLYMPTADGGRSISDAATEALRIANMGQELAGERPTAFKQGARFHFALPGSVQGFQPQTSIEVDGTTHVENVAGHSTAGDRSLAIRYRGVAPGRPSRVETPTFIPSKELADYFSRRGYALLASPTLYPGQTVTAEVSAAADNTDTIRGGLYLQVYGEQDRLVCVRGPHTDLGAGARRLLHWTVPDLGGAPIAAVGVELTSDRRADGSVYLDYLTWDGVPQVVFKKPVHDHAGDMWRQAWVNGLDTPDRHKEEPYRLIQNHGRGLLIQGAREWTDYVVTADVTPHMARAVGIAARVQGMRRYYALLLCDNVTVKLVKALDGDTILAEADFAWSFGQTVDLQLSVDGAWLRATVDGHPLFDVVDRVRPLTTGALALVCQEGRTATTQVAVGIIKQPQ